MKMAKIEKMNKTVGVVREREREREQQIRESCFNL